MNLKEKNVSYGDKIRIINMLDEPQYKGKEGIVEFVDDIGQIHGTWGGCAIIPENDEFEIISHASEQRKTLYRKCDQTQTSKLGIDKLIEYYLNSLKWDEKQACDYALTLFENGTIDQIKVLGKDGKEI